MNTKRNADNSLTRIMQFGSHEDMISTPSCPDETELAAYFDDPAKAADYGHIRDHLGNCKACTAQLSLLSRMQNPELIKPTPELALARAKRLVIQRRTSGLRSVSGWASAAVVVLVLTGVVYTRPGQNPSTPALSDQPSPYVTERMRVSAVSAPRLLKPVADAIVTSANLEFRWTEIPGSLHYDVYIVTPAGDLVSKERVMTTYWRPGVSLAEEHGTEYFVRVDAYLADSKTVSSDHVSFRIGDTR